MEFLLQIFKFMFTVCLVGWFLASTNWNVSVILGTTVFIWFCSEMRDSILEEIRKTTKELKKEN